MLLRRASRVVYENAWMRVREDDVERVDGSRGIYGVVEKPDFAVIIPYDGEGFWLVEQHRYPIGRRAWELPQGSWPSPEQADASTPVDLAAAELAEETGFQAGHVEHIGHLYSAYGFCDQGFDVYLATHLVAGTPSREVTEADMRQRRATRAEIASMIRNRDIVDAATVAAFALLDLTASLEHGAGGSG